MLRLAALLAVSVLVASACTVVKFTEGDSATITHEPGAGQEMAARVCRKGGQNPNAEIISTVNKDPALPPGTGKQVTTFRCVSGPAKP